MPYAIMKSSSNRRGGHVSASTDVYSKRALAGGYGADYNSIFQGFVDASVDLDKVPREATLNVSKPVLPDQFWIENSLLVISDTYRCILEGLDAGVHQIWPMQIIRKRKGPDSGRWFGLNVRGRAAAISEEGSDAKRTKGTEKLSIPPRVKINHATFQTCVDPDALPAEHLWWDDGLEAEGLRFEAILMCSDALHDAVVEAGLKVIPMKKAKLRRAG